MGDRSLTPRTSVRYPHVRVALDVTPAFSGLTGVARYTDGLWRHLARRADVEVRPLAVGRQLHHLATDPELRRVRAPLRLVQSSWRLLGRPRAETLVGNVDLVHSVDLLPPPTRRPLVVTVHDVLPAEHPEWYPPEIVRAHREVLEAARRADAVVATCHATAASIAS